jgi:outer membrane protein TolC
MEMVKKITVAFVLFVIVKATHAQVFDGEVKFLIDNAYNNSSEIKINGYKAVQVATDRRMAQNNRLPRVSANATYTRLNDDIVFPQNLQDLLMGTQKLLIKEHLGLPFNSTFPSSIPLTKVDPIQTKNIFKVTGSAQMLLFSGFKIPMAVKATQHQQRAIELLSDKERNKIIISVNEAYNKLALVFASENVLNTSEKVLNEQALFVEAAIKNGLATPIERQKIELAKQRLEFKRVELASNRTLLIEKLNQLTGIANEVLIKLKPNLQPMLVETDTITVKIATRIEIQSINEALQALTYKQKMEKTEFIPKLAMFGQYEFRKQNLSLLDPVWYAGLRLQWNLFDGFTAKENIYKIEMDKKIFEEQKKEISDLQKLGITKAAVEFATANQKINMTREQLVLAEKMFELTNKQYKNGLTTLTELLSSINEKEKTNLDLIAVYYEQRTAAIQLLDVKGILSVK